MSSSAASGDVTVTVLGSCGGFPEPGRACSGLVIRFDGAALVVDLGYGTYTRLAHSLGGDVAEIAGLVITHAHPDHLVDAHALHRARSYSATAQAPLPLLAPPDVLPVLDRIDPDDIGGPSSDTFQWVPLPDRVTVGPFLVEGVRTQHYIENVSVRVHVGGRIVAVSGDTGMCGALEEVALGADLLVCDATDRFQSSPNSADAESGRYLMTAAEAGLLAHRAEVGHLVLTHFWPGNDRPLSADAAGERFAGPITIADEGMVLRV